MASYSQRGDYGGNKMDLLSRMVQKYTRAKQAEVNEAVDKLAELAEPFIVGLSAIYGKRRIRIKYICNYDKNKVVGIEVKVLWPARIRVLLYLDAYHYLYLWGNKIHYAKGKDANTLFDSLAYAIAEGRVRTPCK